MVHRIKNFSLFLDCGFLHKNIPLAKLFKMFHRSPSAFCSVKKDTSKFSITTILKNGDRNDPNNYRGTCVSSSLGKFFTSIMNQRLLQFSLENNMFYNSQMDNSI